MFNRLFNQNKNDKKDLNTLEEEINETLEKESKEKFIIKYNYLKESLERFTRDKKKLKELRAKLEPEQKEDSSNKKRKYNIFSSCIPGDKGGQNPQDIEKQNESCCTIC